MEFFNRPSRRFGRPAAGGQDDQARFAAFYRANANRVLVYFTRRVFDVEVALDLTAETFARALQAFHQLRGTSEAEAEGWLFAIARSQLSHYWRRGRVAREAAQRMAIERPYLEDADIERIQDAAHLADLRRRVAAALASLSDDQREAVQLRVVDEIGYDEIAARLGVTEQVVRARVSRGLRRLQRELDDGDDVLQEAV